MLALLLKALLHLSSQHVITARQGIKKCLKRSEGLDLGGRRGSSFLIHCGPAGPKLESFVITTAFAQVNFVEQVSGCARRAIVVHFAHLFVQKCELFLDFSGFASELNLLYLALNRDPHFLILSFLIDRRAVFRVTMALR